MTFMELAICPITDEAARRNVEPTVDHEEFFCPSCGRFRISRTALLINGSYPVRDCKDFCGGAGRDVASSAIPMVANIGLHQLT